MNSNEPFALRELKAAGFETILFFPGIGYEQWAQVLLREYTSEVVNALGDDAETVMEELQDMWANEDYTDESTDITKKFCEWAALLKNKAMVDYYYKLVDEANQSKKI